ncbi:NAD(P)-dependent alcohol dehydrogenase [Micromonospora craniellae]|uniref:NAD(P)-dependent alcohol dehydrogenase n=1 Tax=Micromonospora craniellae TaxID=2294034 RepID=A0A372FYE1_9ACTN|nr:NAD(P)-dependent alcohol dehydrogenase [Micromonospora craniellae]QOC91558.1 NAD(P)-dependent alcohol dehydrogenase [Micromonospora craniellae]RFS45510.1 NAD(P)-dependent alcohol dehydrogenase [Micromonospora craniellae]
MKAIVQQRYGSPGVLRLQEVDKPAPAAHEVLVRVHAASVNARDWHVLRGDPYLARLAAPQMMGLRGPTRKIRGTDFAGRVEAVGSGVDRFRPGAEVYGDTGDVHGAFAEYVCVPAEQIEAKPANLSFAQAATMPLAGSTALSGLRDLAQLRDGQHVLINGASGGVGTFAVQIGKALGATVTAVCSTRNVDLARSLGADHVVDYTTHDFVRLGRRYDVLLDLVGNRSLGDLRRALAPGGTLVLSGGGTSRGRPGLVGPMGLLIGAQVMARVARERILVLPTPLSRELLAALRELAEAGMVSPVIDRTYKLDEVPEAIRYMEVEHARAKIVVTV